MAEPKNNATIALSAQWMDDRAARPAAAAAGGVSRSRGEQEEATLTTAWQMKIFYLYMQFAVFVAHSFCFSAVVAGALLH